MVIDAHVYCLPPRLRNPEAIVPAAEEIVLRTVHHSQDGPYALNLAKPEAILASMNDSSIDRVVLVAFPWVHQNLCNENNDYLLETLAKYNCFWGICAIQPKSKTWQADAERYLNEGSLGIKVNPAWQGFELDGPEMEEVADFVEHHNVFLMLHVDHGFRKSAASPAHLYNLAKKHPNTRILAAHLGGLLGIYSLHKPVSEVLRNVWFDTAVSSTLKMVDFFVKSGLEDKIIFGSDFPFNHSHSQAQVLQGIRALNLKETTLEKILRQNISLLIDAKR